MKNFTFTATLLIIAALVSPFAQTKNIIPLGMWVTVFTPEKVLYSKESADRMLEVCTRSGISHIYLQVYRANRAYYDSDITDSSLYEKAAASAGCDPVKYILDQAKKKNIQVHAWVNILSLAENRDAEILKKYGDGILTLDQHGETSMPSGTLGSRSDFIREGQLFIEPGDWRVKEYLVNITGEILRKYPDFSGLHLDYIRYPAAMPFGLGSRFDTHSISYGYTDVNKKKCKKITGLDVSKMRPSRSNYLKWDNWRRDQVSELLAAISQNVKKISPACKISCAVIPSIERAYMVTFQNWVRWLEEGLADYVVAMNYTDDMSLMELNTRSALLTGLKDRVYIGVGAYLLKDTPKKTEEEIKITKNLSPGGIVIFSYDEIAKSEELQAFLKNLSIEH